MSFQNHQSSVFGAQKNSPAVDTDALTRIPLPAILADRGYAIQQTGIDRFIADSHDRSEHLSVSRLSDGKWLYKDLNSPQANRGNALNFMQLHGAPNFRAAASELAPYLQPARISAANALMADLNHRQQDAGREELQKFNAIPLGQFVEAHGWRLNSKESTRTWEKYDGPAGDTIVINPGQNFYFHQQDKEHDKGGVVQFVQTHVLNGSSLGEARKYLRDFSGDMRDEWRTQPRIQPVAPHIEDRRAEWKALSSLSPKSTNYLISRGLKKETLDAYSQNIRTEVYRLPSGGELHNVAFAHVAIDADGKPVISGWEKKGPGKEKTFNGFDGHRGIAVFKHRDFANSVARGEDAGTCQRVVLCESSIDALSKAQMDKLNPGNIYVSVGGTPSAAAEKSLGALIQRNKPREVVLAFDNDEAGRTFADHMDRRLTRNGEPDFSIRTETSHGKAKDWNDMIRPAPAHSKSREASFGIGG
jgi:hypothetical protein